MVSKKKEENTYQNSDRYVFYFLGELLYSAGHPEL
jgi:hypothetical protein